MHKNFFLTFIILTIFSCKNNPFSEKQKFVFTDSLDYYNQLLSAYPKQDSIHYSKGLYLIYKNKIDSGILEISKAIKLNPTKIEYSFSLSDAYLLNLESKKAAEVIDTLLNHFPNDIKTLLKKARLQLILKEYLPSLTVLNKVYSIDPENSEAYYLAGHIFYEQGDTGRAVKSYQKAVDYNPEFTEAWIQLADIMTNMHNSLALQYYDNAVRLDSNNIETLHNKAFAIQTFGNLDEAIKLYKINALKRPDYELSFYNLGIIYFKKDSFLIAKNYFDQAIQLNQNEASSFFYRAKCNLNLSDKNNAFIDTKKALELYPQYIEAIKFLDQLKK